MEREYSRISPSEKRVLIWAKQCQAVVLDYDGTVTNNLEWAAIGQTIKARSHYDGQGISLLRDARLRIAIATSADEHGAHAARELVQRWNYRLPSVQDGVANLWPRVELFTGVAREAKANQVFAWLNDLRIPSRCCAVMGDDLTDLPMLEIAGLRAAPVTAEEIVRRRCHFVSARPAGQGAVRDLANFILRAKGIDPTKLRLC